MATATKIAAFGAILRVFYVALPNEYVNWRPLMWAVAILTMVVGSIVAVTQTDMKRMLAYSAIAHTGFIRSEEHTSELQSLMRISYAVFCLKKKQQQSDHTC